MNNLLITPPPSRWARFWASPLGDSLRGNPVALVALLVFSVIVVLALLAPVIAPFDPYDPTQIDIMNSDLPPFWIPGAEPQFVLGSDDQGRDMWSAILYGTRLSLMIGLAQDRHHSPSLSSRPSVV